MSRKPLEPALVIGSGFHKHVLRSSADDRKALYHWDTLIDATADKMHVERPPKRFPETLRWEALISQAARDGYRDCKGRVFAPQETQAHGIEKVAKRAVAEILRSSTEDYPTSERARIPRDRKWGCVISLNFDIGWHPERSGRNTRPLESHFPSNLNSATTQLETKRVAGSFVSTSAHVPRVWFPNGSILKPETIRMGLHDYGAAPTAIRVAFNLLKSWEKSTRGEHQTRQRCDFERLANGLRHATETRSDSRQTKRNSPFPLTWVAEFLYRPLVIAGAGLSEQEIGLWWLLAQRARNTARVAGPIRNSVRVLVKKKSPRADFWAASPFGIEAVTCEEWEDGWNKLMSS